MIGALDIGGTKIAAGLVSRDGKAVAQRRCATESERGFDDGVARMKAMLRDLERETGATIEGIGIGCTGPVDPVTGTIGKVEFLREWLGAPLVMRLSDEFGIRVAMENDADAVALAEAAWGLGRGASCLVYVTVGTGIGAGIVRGGELYRGANGAHSEIGHVPLDVTAGPRCYCGLSGCWESLASGPAMEAWYAEGGSRVPAEEIFRRAANEPRARDCVERMVRYLGLGLTGVVTTWCPDVIVLGGGMVRDAAMFIDDVRLMVKEFATQVPTDRLRIETVEDTGIAGLQGAAAAWLHRYERI